MILVRIGDITFSRVLVDTGFGINVMSNQIRIRLGYHRMAPPTTKLAMADNTLVWPLPVLSAIPVMVEGVRLIVSFQVIEMEDPEYTQLILGRIWQKGARAIIDMDEEVVHIRAGTNLTTVKWSGVAAPGTVQVQQAQPVDWDFAGGFTDEDEDQFLNDQPYIVSMAEVNLVPLTDEEKQKELRKYLKSIKRKMTQGVPPQVPAYPGRNEFLRGSVWSPRYSPVDRRNAGGAGRPR
ncbi:hypothetical protein R1flu_018800 [Riccia fluitans]|uniref:Aspartic peptidase DDI1-type domain-containing protein n=1 Tax=Riccia fluitans TaxID=41844 RepID=A0ABD1ZGV5_9MARC